MAVSTVANSESFKVTTPSDREIRLTRLFDAPRHLVFEALTKSEHVKQWWGCLGDGYSCPVADIDLRPGGRWRYVNRFPQGECAFHGVFREITPPERLVYTEVFEQGPDAEPDSESDDDSVVTVVLTDENGKTRLTLTARYPSLEVRDIVINSGMERGAAISYDRLEDVVARLKTR